MDSYSDASVSQAERDASMARGAAIGLEDATPERFEATMKVVLLSYYGGDASRIAAAAAVCRANHEECDTAGWDEAAALLEQALQRLHSAGADVGEAERTAFVARLREEMFPEPEPFTWPDRTAPERGRLRRAWVHARVRMQRQAPRRLSGDEVLLLRLGRVIVGKLVYQVCDQCRRGYVRELNVYEPYKGLGLGSRVLRVARRGRAGYVWQTSPQYPTAGTFWTAVGYDAAESKGVCPHMGNP
ncbi:hypothetical protein AB0F81_29775 [Actinoplanes sp. NPDC024001]|uniref:hypothetical protein n=1 Tax=Actinoplanes sp. NPDC024001 TaxID=3154598 RepID=UPI0033E9BF32